MRSGYLLPIALPVVALLTVPVPSGAQTFRVEKYNIGGEGGTDHITAEPGTGRGFVSRSTHVMVVDGPTGRVIGLNANAGDIVGTGDSGARQRPPAAGTDDRGVVHRHSRLTVRCQTGR